MNVLITGGNGGLGLAIARRFLRDAGNAVWLGVHRHRDAAQTLVDENPDRCHLVDLDVTNPEAWGNAVAAITTSAERVDVLVNNAGFHRDGLLAMMSIDDWSSVIDANLNGAFLGCRAVTKVMMRHRFGRIINIASLSALLAPRGQANYAAAKAGLVAMTQSLAKETARSGITVNALCPGYIDTEALVDLPETERKGLLASIPMRRLGKPEEVAATVAFLAGQDAGYITGAALKIDGGIL